MTFPALMITGLLLAAVAWCWRPLGRLLYQAKRHLIGYCELRREKAVARKVSQIIAEQIEMSVCGPGEYCQDRFCPDCIRYQQGLAAADLARRIGKDWPVRGGVW